jgi:hypothetical protein|tara:strand:+ start:238 stop:432 length:195 start_codon:yes stop_codon:yes gene_type:complete
MPTIKYDGQLLEGLFKLYKPLKDLLLMIESLMNMYPEYNMEIHSKEIKRLIKEQKIIRKNVEAN